VRNPTLRKLRVLLCPVYPLSLSYQTHSSVSQGLATVATRRAVQTHYVDLWTNGDEYTTYIHDHVVQR